MNDGRRALVAALLGAPVVSAADRPADAEILHASIVLEHHAIALYDHVLGSRLLPHAWHARAVDFRGDHLGHRDTQVALAQARGVRAPEPRAGYDLPDVAGREAVRALHEIERAAQDAYAGLLGGIRTEDYLLTAGYVLADEARHLVVWSHALGMRIY